MGFSLKLPQSLGFPSAYSYPVIEQFLLFSGTWDAASNCDEMSDHWSESLGGRLTSPIVLISQYILDVTSLQEYSDTVSRSFC